MVLSVVGIATARSTNIDDGKRFRLAIGRKASGVGNVTRWLVGIGTSGQVGCFYDSDSGSYCWINSCGTRCNRPSRSITPNVTVASTNVMPSRVIV